MAETFSVERRKLMRFLGAKVVLTPGGGAEVSAWSPRPWNWPKRMAGFSPVSSRMKPMPTCTRGLRRRRYWRISKGERLDYWVTGFGTGGTLKGVARVLAKERPETKIVVCEPDDAPMLSSGIAQERNPDGSPSAPHPAWKPHPMQGWSPDFIAKLAGDAVDTKAISQMLRITNADAMRCSKELARKEGIFVGISFRRNVRGGVAGCAEAPQGIDDSVHAAGYGRALPEHSAVRRCFRRHDAGRGGDFALHSERVAAACVRGEMSKEKTMSRFELEEEGETAYLEFELDNAGWITLWHTEVPQALRGRGMAGVLAKTALEYARDNQLEGGCDLSSGGELSCQRIRSSSLWWGNSEVRLGRGTRHSGCFGRFRQAQVSDIASELRPRLWR